MAIHSSILAWEIPGTELPGRVRSTGSQKSRTRLSDYARVHAIAGDTGSIPGSGRSPGEGKDYPLQYSCLKNPTARGVWRATVNTVTKESDTAE